MTRAGTFHEVGTSAAIQSATSRSSIFRRSWRARSSEAETRPTSTREPEPSATAFVLLLDLRLREPRRHWLCLRGRRPGRGPLRAGFALRQGTTRIGEGSTGGDGTTAAGGLVPDGDSAARESAANLGPGPGLAGLGEQPRGGDGQHCHENQLFHRGPILSRGSRPVACRGIRLFATAGRLLAQATGEALLECGSLLPLSKAEQAPALQGISRCREALLR